MSKEPTVFFLVSYFGPSRAKRLEGVLYKCETEQEALELFTKDFGTPDPNTQVLCERVYVRREVRLAHKGRIEIQVEWK